MKAIAYILLTVLTLTFVSCEKIDSDEQIMFEYYQESMNLKTYTHDEVQAFGNEFVAYIENHPEEKSNCYFHETWLNILAAGYEVKLTFTFDDDWEGTIEYSLD